MISYTYNILYIKIKKTKQNKSINKSNTVKSDHKTLSFIMFLYLYSSRRKRTLSWHLSHQKLITSINPTNAVIGWEEG